MTSDTRSLPIATSLINLQDVNSTQFFTNPDATVELRNNQRRTTIKSDIDINLYIGEKKVDLTLQGTARVTENKRTAILEIIPGSVLSFGTNPKLTINGEARFDLRTGNITLSAGSSLSIGDVTVTGARTFNTLKGTFTDQFNAIYNLKETIDEGSNRIAVNRARRSPEGEPVFQIKLKL